MTDPQKQAIAASAADQPWTMDQFHSEWLEQIVSALERGDLSESQLPHALKNTFDANCDAFVDVIGPELDRRESAMLREHRTLQRGFVRRNMRRWKCGFDKLERLIVMSQEFGEAISHAIGAQAKAENSVQFEAAISNHARAVLVAREIFCLMVNGYPDGALARWRTLHEIAVINQFISKNGEEAAERYLAHRHWVSYQYARVHQRHASQASLEPIALEQYLELEATAQAVLAKYGAAMKSDYGWAKPFVGNDRPKFSDLEDAAELSHWRPRYKWACLETHGAYHDPFSGLGMSEATSPIRLVGQSNSGMTDPGHMTAITLNLATAPVLSLAPNLDRAAMFRLMMALSDEIGEALWKVQKRSQASRLAGWDGA